MKTKYIDVSIEKDDEKIKEAALNIKLGKLVIFPTETVYGIGTNALDEKAVSKIFIAKGRKNDNPLIVHVDGKEMLESIVDKISNVEQKLIDNFFPGPLTIVFKKKQIIPDNATCNLDTVGVRMPKSKIFQKIIKYAGVPIAAPSANISGRPSGTKIEDIYLEFESKVDFVIDDGNSEIGLESTVVVVKEDIVNILRPGYVTCEDIEKIGLKVKIDKNVLINNSNKTAKVFLSPGMKYKHYAPSTKSILVSGKNDEKIKYINNQINKYKKLNKEVVVICRNINLNQIICKQKIGFGNSLEEISKNIFSSLRKADILNKDLIIIEAVEKEGLGLAIMNRLIRACEYNEIKV